MKSKIIDNGYIVAINYGKAGIPITEEEFVLIQEKVSNPPITDDNQYALLKDETYEWEIFTNQQEEQPIEEEDDINLLDILTGEI